MTIVRAAAAALAFALASGASAAVVIEGKEGDKTQRFVMDGKKLRLESGEGSEAMIFDAATQRSIQLDPATKTYTEFKKEDLDKLQAMMKERGGPKKVRTTKYEKTGKTDTALGKSCDVYRVVESDAEADDTEQTLCLAPFGTFGVNREDFAPFRAFGEFASQLSGGEVERSWADVPGIPVIAWEKEDGQRKETFRATKVERRSVPATAFEVPAGWKKGPSVGEQMRDMQQQMPPEVQEQMQQRTREQMKHQGAK
ncbi:MAG TPA: DUF4412 domain-containing protein [Anaeromyxobacteraceae bacterium]|nr:DUF4412 domain-containing protein [Anaeromyxobacteraceae bacterium]